MQGKMRTSSRSSNRAIPIPLKPLQEGHRMDPQERLFLEAAERGDNHTMIRCLQGPNPVNVNCTNILGRSAIQIAVDNENGEIVELLLKQEGVKIGDALLYAIREGVYKIVEMLIDHPSITREMLGSDWGKHKPAGEESSEYSPDISPVILAAHCNQFEILQLLLSRGARIERPHTMTCSCSRCSIEVKEDSLRHSLLRINSYRALSSPAWISLTSPDPVLTAFKLSWELEKLARRENEFQDIYAELNEQCKKYSCDLLDQCRSTEEVIAVLNKENRSESDDDEVNYEKLTLDRLKLALKYEQKQFVAHPNTQQLLASIWYEGVPGWRKRNLAMKVLILIGLIALMPLVAVYYLLLPRSRLGQLIRAPFVKFVYHSASFGAFLFLLTLASTNVGGDAESKTQRSRQRGPPPSELEWLIVFYVTGFVWAECKQLWEEGFKAYVRQWWNWLDFIMLSLYLCTFSLRIVAFFQSQNEDQYGDKFMPRNLWPDADPTLVSEGVFAIANVFSFARIIYLFQANPQLGPLQISLGCMLLDIGKFLFIFFLVLISFACGLNQLYYYYSDTDFLPSETINRSLAHNITERPSTKTDDFENAFDPLDRTCVTLFWAVFTLVALVTLEIELHLVEAFGKLLFGLYNVAAKIMLLNMLIAMMSKSFHHIADHADREWKFARSKLWMGYFDEGSTLPSPFNLIISPKSVYYFVRDLKDWFQSCLKPSTRPPAVSSHRNRRRKSNATAADGTITRRQQLSVVGYANSHVQGGGVLQLDSGLTSSKSLYEGNPGQRLPPTIPLPQIGKATGGTRLPNTSIEETSHNGDVGGTFQGPGPDRPKYQDVMRRLVSRFIHQWKKQMRQDGVSEDDLLEIKQDISSLRYELREDRKRETIRTTGTIDNLKRDIIRSMHHGPSTLAARDQFSVGEPYLSPASQLDLAALGEVSAQSALSGGILTPSELDCLKRDIVSSLKTEIRDIAREIATSSMRGTSPVNAPTLPSNSSELYHTHLYTQL